MRTWVGSTQEPIYRLNVCFCSRVCSSVRWFIITIVSRVVLNRNLSSVFIQVEVRFTTEMIRGVYAKDFIQEDQVSSFSPFPISLLFSFSSPSPASL